MMSPRTFLDLPDAGPDDADVVLLPLPFEGTVSYGRGTAGGPESILAASCQVELWDEELDFDLDKLSYHWAEPVAPQDSEDACSYLERVFTAAQSPHQTGKLVVGIGGEHSLTAPLARAAAGADDLTDVTVVQFDAHADLRDEYEGDKHSHACVMRRVLERGASVVAIGIRSAEREEMEHGRSSARYRAFLAQRLAEGAHEEAELLSQLRGITGDVYLTFDVDALEVMYSPATGTPQPGGLTWWQTLRYLRALLMENPHCRIIGCDVVETSSQPGTTVNEFTSARLVCKILAYLCQGSGRRES
ncbi:N(1)-aminopropylagmatine ureohydrolase [Symmachiella dynata]|uniref:N(1)-aminopropylagmatine ureohydrolase n=1 Tax=Symmachiella dynata TaxID=2527995 RepID=A0A517ZH98_9PLAN|nr:agmatinase [Symmachiella dynata]QDU41856.1 N(1)-aminopropylagmatine ureohydrolase [Symmachiella dynata]